MVTPAARATHRSRLCAAALALGVGLTLILTGTTRANSDVLWNIVHNLCVPDEKEHGKPAPCTAVDLRNGEQNGYVVLKDLFGATQFLLIPTARITGIESSVLLAPDAPNYFARAWQSRVYIDRVVHRALPRDDVALAVNSVSGRTQNQLHIHIDCVRSDVRDALHKHETSIRDRWAPLRIVLAGHRYTAMRVEGEQLGQTNPFKLLADGLPGAREDMGHHTLVVIGGSFSNGHSGFIILDDHADPATGDKASGEELQDHTCAIAKSS
jgi:CDP-diacylglycerol pyrophosphatase